MIKLKKSKKETSKKKTIPYYKLVFNYMIGDADGQTNKICKIATDHPYVERFVKLLNSVKPVKGTWGIILNKETLDKFLKEKQISKDDHKFLKNLMFEEYEEDNEYKCYDFYDCIQSDTEYSFLVFEGIDLYYYDEKGIKHETEIK